MTKRPPFSLLVALALLIALKISKTTDPRLLPSSNPLQTVIVNNINITLLNPSIAALGPPRPKRKLPYLAYSLSKSKSTNASISLPSLLLLSGDIESNPGPNYKFPCGVCARPSKKNQNSIQCDKCGISTHKNSLGMNDKVFECFAYCLTKNYNQMCLKFYFLFS